MSRGVAGRVRFGEGLVLAVGLASGVLLVVAALAPFSDPALAGRAAFAQLAGRVADGVVSEWERMLRDPTLPGWPASRWTAEQRQAASQLPPEERPPPATEASAGVAFEVLLAEARRAESSGDARAALDGAREALRRQAPSARRGAAHLLAVRAAVELGACDDARAQWEQAAAELDGSEVEEGLPLLVACALAAQGCLSNEERAAAQALVVASWTAGRVGAALRTSEVPQAPLRATLQARVEALAPGSEAARALGDHEGLRRLAELAREVGGLPERPGDDRWHLRPFEERLLAWRAEGVDAVVVQVVMPQDLAGALEARLLNAGLLPEGFVLDFGRAATPGEPVREREELVGEQLGFVLRHLDPEGARRAQGGRLALLRGALLIVALLTVGASVATFRALRRGRLLAELKSSFVANVSHELRTPLASILMLSENLEQGRVSDEAARARYHGLIRREAERLRRLVADVLDFSRLERGRPLELRREPVDVRQFVEDLRGEALAWSSRSGVPLACDLGPLGGRARLDADALRRALSNLLENARKHGGGGQIELSAALRDGQLVIGVGDHGPGVPSEAREAIFEPFTRLERGDGAAGTGLGLSIVRETARAHGGDVVLAQPPPGGGARFELRLPVETRAEAREVEA